MNKNAILLASLLMCGFAGNVFGFNEEQREILYALHDLDQNFAAVPMIAENIDMFIGMMDMNIQINKKKLQDATIKRNKTLIKNIAATVALFIVRDIVTRMSGDSMSELVSKYSVLSWNIYEILNKWITKGVYGGIVAIANVYLATTICDAFKAKNALEESLALDNEILAKLQKVKDSLEVPAATTIEKDLLKKIA